VANQEIHTQYGGVVPDVHQQNIVPVIDAALRKANIDKEQLSAIAFTQGPDGVTWWEVLLQNRWLWPYPYLLYQ
jgi:tRNA A37 threonylcarbamoyltransferase TsaD